MHSTRTTRPAAPVAASAGRAELPRPFGNRASRAPGAPAALHLRRALLAGAAALALAACQGPIDSDLRGYGNGFSTAEAARNLPNRPRPDDRGVISYPNYQVALARQDDTVRSLAGRLGIEAETLARYNGMRPDDPLRRDEVIALPGRVTEPSPATGAIGTGPIRPAPAIDVTTLASSAIDRAGAQPQPPAVAPAPAPAPVAAPQPAPQTAPQTGAEPIRHQVLRGETAYSIARRYDVPLRSIAEWNALGPELGIREGQFLLIPVAGAAPPPRATTTTSAPGAGSVAPAPPSASAPLPAPVPAAQPAPAPAPPAPDLAAAPAASGKPLAFPVQGSIIRAYAPGRNEGIDIAAPAGTPVKAAAAGTVAAVTRNTDGINIVVIRHEGSLLTVYTHIEELTVAKDATVRQGQTIGKVRPGDPSFLHFEVRRGMQSADPTDFLP